MSDRIKNFKRRWATEYGYISLELTDSEIEKFLADFSSLEMAMSMASDYLLASGTADVQE